MSNFKIGDKVRVLGDDKGIHEEGSVLIIRSIDPNYEHASVDGNCYFFEGKTTGLFAQEIELCFGVTTVEDLEVGHLIQYRCGEFAMVMPTLLGLKFVDEDGSYLDSEYYHSLTMDSRWNPKYDIMKVYGLVESTKAVFTYAPEVRGLLWSRPNPPKPVKEVTMEELQELLGYEVKIKK